MKKNYFYSVLSLAILVLAYGIGTAKSQSPQETHQEKVTVTVKNITIKSSVPVFGPMPVPTSEATVYPTATPYAQLKRVLVDQIVDKGNEWHWEPIFIDFVVLNGRKLTKSDVLSVLVPTPTSTPERIN